MFSERFYNCMCKDVQTKFLTLYPGGVREVKEHPFFQELDLDDLLSENPQFVPHQHKEDDTSCFSGKYQQGHEKTE